MKVILCIIALLIGLFASLWANDWAERKRAERELREAAPTTQGR